MKDANMKTAQQQVKEFHAATGCYIGDKPHIPPAIPVRRLRHNLINEELYELLQAEAANDIVGVADALADLLYVVIGTCVAYGIDIAPVFEEVHRSNMTKTIDGSFRVDGKYLKGPNYEPANIAPIVFDQIASEENQPQLKFEDCESDYS